MTVDVDVKNSNVEIGTFCEPYRVIDFTRLGGDAVTKLLEHVHDHHANHDLVFDEEHGAPPRCRCCHAGCPLPSSPLRVANKAAECNVNVTTMAVLTPCRARQTVAGADKPGPQTSTPTRAFWF